MNDRWFIHDSFTMSFIKKKKKIRKSKKTMYEQLVHSFASSKREEDKKKEANTVYRFISFYVYQEENVDSIA